MNIWMFLSKSKLERMHMFVFFTKTTKSYIQAFLEFCQCWRVKKMWYGLNFEPLLYIGIILLVFKIEGSNPEEKDWLKSNASWSDMSLFNNFRILVWILFGSSLLSRFKEEIILETSVLSVGVVKSDSVFKSGKCHNIFSWKISLRIECL